MASSTTQIITFRLPNEVVDIIKRRIKGTGYPRTVSSYLRNRIIYDVTRKHGGGRKII